MRASSVFVMLTLVTGGGCVMVNPGDVCVGGPAPIEVGRPRSTEPMTPYGSALQRVIVQQDKVLKELSEGDMSQVVDEAGDWTEYVRSLNGYAGTSHDPARFRQYCEQLLVHTQGARDAGMRRDSVRCEQAIRACDPILNNFSRDFPLNPYAPPPRPASSPNPSPAPRSPSPPRVP